MLDCNKHQEEIHLFYTNDSEQVILISRFDEEGLFSSLKLSFDKSKPILYSASQTWWKKEFGYSTNNLNNAESFAFIKEMFDNKYTNVEPICTEKVSGYRYVRNLKCDCLSFLL